MCFVYPVFAVDSFSECVKYSKLVYGDPIVCGISRTGTLFPAGAFLPARHATTGISNPLYNLPSQKKKADELTERQHHLIPMKKGLCGLQKLILLRHHPSDLSLQVVRVGRTGIFIEVFADYVCVSEERKRTTADVCL